MFNDELATSRNRLDVIININWWFFIVEGSVLVLTSLYVLVKILKDKNRDKDFIYIALVSLMLLYGIF